MIDLSPLTQASGLTWNNAANQVHQLQMLSLMKPNEPITLFEYRFDGALLDPLLRFHLEHCRNSTRNIWEGDQYFTRLTKTLRYALACEPALLWCEVPRYIPKENKFSDIVIKMLPEQQQLLNEQRLEQLLIEWLREDLAREHLPKLGLQIQKWRDQGFLKTKQHTLQPPTKQLVPYPAQGDYFTAAALRTALHLANDPAISTLLATQSGTQALKPGQSAPTPALRVNFSTVELIGQPKQQLTQLDRWTSNIIRIRSAADIGFPGLTVNLSLHTRVYGTLAESADSAPARQLLIFDGIYDQQLTMRQYPFVFKGEKKEAQLKFTDKPGDIAGQTIERFFNLYTPWLDQTIPRQVTASPDGGQLAAPLLASTLQDKNVVKYSGATSTERFDIYQTANKILSPHGYQAMPTMQHLAKLIARNRGTLGTVPFHQDQLYKDHNPKRRQLLRQALEDNQGSLKLRLEFRDAKPKDYPSMIKGLLKSWQHWCGCEFTSQFTVEGTVFTSQQKGLNYGQRYGHGSELKLKSKDFTGHGTLLDKTTGDEKCPRGQIAKTWWWEWSLQLKDTTNTASFKHILLSNLDKLSETLDQQLNITTPEPTLYSEKRSLFALQCGDIITLPVFGDNPHLLKAFDQALFDIFGAPHRREVREAGDELFVYFQPQAPSKKAPTVQLTIQRIRWPLHSSGDESWSQMVSLLPELTGKDWQKQADRYGQKRQRKWQPILEAINDLRLGKTVLPVIWLPAQSKKSPRRDPKPWLRDLFNGYGWVAKFILSWQNEAGISTEMQQKLNATLLAQLTNHGVSPMVFEPLFRDKQLIDADQISVTGLTLIKNYGENIPVVWRTLRGYSQFGLRDNDGGIVWYSPAKAIQALTLKPAKNHHFAFTKDFTKQRSEAQLFLSQLIRAVDIHPGILLVNGEACRTLFSHFANRNFDYDRLTLQHTAVIRINSETSLGQYYAVDEAHSKSGANRSGFGGLYAHPGSPRRAMILASRYQNTTGFQRSSAENRFVELDSIVNPLPELMKTGEKSKDPMEGSRMMRLTECVLTDLPRQWQNDTAKQQYLHCIVKRLLKTHLEKPMDHILPYPIHELTGVMTDMAKPQYKVNSYRLLSSKAVET